MNIFTTYTFVTFFGLCIGSFLNVVALRVIKGETIRGRSHCMNCKKTLCWYELFPVVSWIFQRGRCRKCHTRISVQYPLVELATALLFLAVFMTFNPSWLLVASYWFLFAGLIVLFITDIRFGFLPDIISLPTLAIAVVIVITQMPDITIQSLANVAATTLIGAGFFWMQRLLSKNKWCGDGDIRLGAIMGAMLGLAKLAAAFFIAYVGGALIALILLATKRVTRKTRLPFGPFLITATFITFFWGQQIIDWYWNRIY